MKYFLTTVLSISGLAAAAEKGFSGQIETKDGGLGGTVMVVNDTTLSISSYTLEDASAPALYWWGATDSDLPNGFRINNERVDESASSDEITIPLDNGYTANDFSYVGLWCETLNANFGQAKLTKEGETSGDDDSSNDMVGAAPRIAAEHVTLGALAVNALAFAAYLI